jgi:hypothetical protein
MATNKAAKETTMNTDEPTTPNPVLELTLNHVAQLATTYLRVNTDARHCRLGHSIGTLAVYSALLRAISANGLPHENQPTPDVRIQEDDEAYVAVGGYLLHSVRKLTKKQRGLLDGALAKALETVIDSRAGVVRADAHLHRSFDRHFCTYIFETSVV